MRKTPRSASKRKPACGQRLAHHVVAAGHAPETLEDQCWAEGAGVGAGVVGRGQGGQDGGVFGEPGAGLQEPVESAAGLQLVEAAEGRDHALADLLALAEALDELEVGVVGRGFGTEEHGRLRRSQHRDGLIVS